MFLLLGDQDIQDNDAQAPSNRLEAGVDKTLQGFRRIIGIYEYYIVFTIFIRPIVLIGTAVSVYQQKGADFIYLIAAFILAILAFIFSFPFVTVKAEEASYLVKIHYPFLFSRAAG